MPMKPIANLIATSEVTEAVNHPMNTPINEAGINIFKLRALKFLRYNHTPKMSEIT